MNRTSVAALFLTLAPVLAFAPAGAESRIEREFDIGSGGTLLVDTDSGSVGVVGTSGSVARIVVTSRKDDLESHFDVEMSGGPGRVEVRLDRKGSKLGRLFNWGNGGGVKVEIEVPSSTEIDIDTAGGSIEVDSIARPARLDTSGGSIRARRIGGALVADTSGGSIEIVDVDGDVVADTSGGSIKVEGVRGDLRADTSGGGISIDDVSGDIRADTSGGEIRIRGAGGHVFADTSGGPVTVEFAPGNSSGGEISTSGGGIRVAIDPTADLDLDAACSGGSVIADVPVTVRGQISKSSVQGKIGQGGAKLRLRTSGGSIRVESR